MALGPDSVNQIRLQFYYTAEKIIDEAILTNHHEGLMGLRVLIDVVKLGGITRLELEEHIFPKYKKAGWDFAEVIVGRSPDTDTMVLTKIKKKRL